MFMFSLWIYINIYTRWNLNWFSKNAILSISRLGYNKKEVDISNLKHNTKIKLEEAVTQLNEVSILTR